MNTGELLPLENFKEVINIIRKKRNELLRTANVALIETYWQVGKYVSEKIASSSWGDSVVKQLADYISRTEPDLKGFSKENLHRMCRFYDTYKDNTEIVSTLLTQISWSHNRLIISRCGDPVEREFYARLTIRDSLSFRELDRQIDAAVYERTMIGQKKLSPVVKQLPEKASCMFRDHYVMEYITGHEAKPEDSLRRALLHHMKEFVLEMGKDFIPMGEEYRVQVGMTDFRIDLLFYHRELQCLVALELKTRKFEPGDLGQLNFYLEALDRDVKKPHENPSIGILLCADKDDEVVEYAMSRSLSPTMVARYELNLPDKHLLQQKMREVFLAEEENQE